MWTEYGSLGTAQDGGARRLSVLRIVVDHRCAVSFVCMAMEKTDYIISIAAS